MSKSLRRVEAALAAAGVVHEIHETAEGARTARDAADAVGCEIDQIAKSIVVEGENSGALFLFITAGGNRVDTDRVTALLGEPTHPASGTTVRAVTGFAIGGVAPVGHKTPIRAFFDPRLADFTEVWAAAGTPRHVFRTDPAALAAAAEAETADFTA